MFWLMALEKLIGSSRKYHRSCIIGTGSCCKILDRIPEFLKGFLGGGLRYISALVCALGNGRFRHVHQVCPNRGPHKKGPHKRSGKFFAM